MTILDAAFWAVCLVLVASGATKVAEPESFAAALAALGIGPLHADGSGTGRWPAVVVGVAEIGIGLNGLVLGGPVVAALAAAAYALFALVVLVARRRGTTRGPAASRHAIRAVPSASMLHATASRPAGVESAPYFAALVASS